MRPGQPTRLLVLDEPTVGLDPVLRVDLWEQFTELARAGTTLLASSHVMDEADHCRDLLLMRDGRLMAHATPTRLREDTGCTSLEEAFLSIIRRTTAPAEHEDSKVHGDHGRGSCASWPPITAVSR